MTTFNNYLNQFASCAQSDVGNVLVLVLIHFVLQTKRPKIQPPTFRLKASYCKLCRCQFGTSTALAQHLVTHGIFLCLTCGKEFTNDETFRDHQKVHLPSSALIPSVSRKNSVKTCKRNKKK